MINKSLIKSVKITKVIPATTAGTSTVVGTTLDMQNFEGVCFLGSFGTSAANNGISFAEGTDSGGSGAADCLGSSVLCNGTGKEVATEDVRPRQRYVTVSALRGTSTTIDGVWALQWGARTEAINNTVANTRNAEYWVSPAAGTA